MIHELKTWPKYYRLALDGSKRFECRKNDRDYWPGDMLWLKEYCPVDEAYTGRWLFARVTLVLDDCPGLLPGYVLMAIKRVRRYDSDGRDVTDLPGLWGEADVFSTTPAADA